MLLIKLIDQQLKNHKLDLNFVVYEVLPFSQKDGIMRCVTGTKAVEDIVRNGKISDYLRRFNPDDAAYEAALETYVRSCAGNCVLNMVLGWGDRHAANLLLAQDGNLVHIDFGFILGNEPNWDIFKIVLRLDANMLEPLGAPNSPWMEKFYSYAHAAYNILRNFGGSILSILYVMRSMFNKDDPSNLNSINFVRDRLLLGYTDAEALNRLQETLNSAPNSFTQSLQDWWRSWKH